MNQEREHSLLTLVLYFLYLQQHIYNVQAHQLMVFYYSTVKSTVKKVTTHILDFALVGDLGFYMMPQVKAIKTSEIQSAL